MRPLSNHESAAGRNIPTAAAPRTQAGNRDVARSHLQDKRNGSAPSVDGCYYCCCCSPEVESAFCKNGTFFGQPGFVCTVSHDSAGEDHAFMRVARGNAFWVVGP